MPSLVEEDEEEEMEINEEIGCLVGRKVLTAWAKDAEDVQSNLLYACCHIENKVWKFDYWSWKLS